MRQAAIVLLVLGGIALLAGEHAMPATPGTPDFLYTVAKRYEPLAWMQGEDRFPAGAAIFMRDAKGGHALVPDFAASADAAVSFDGKKALFAGKRTARDHWQIWEIALAGGDAKRITNCAGDCVRPFYLPEDHIVYGEKVGGRFVIQNGDLAGGKPLSITYGAENSVPTDVLRDGRVLFEAAYAPTGTPELYTVYPDGSGVESYRCDHGARRFAGRQMSSGDIVFAQEHGMGRFTSALAKEVRVEMPAGDYAGEIAETNAGEWLVPWRARGGADFRLMWWRPGQAGLRPAIDEAGRNILQPVLVGETVVPKRFPSGLHDWQVGNLLCLNSYTSKYKFAAESIRSVRLYTRDSAGSAQVLGAATVESDGSFYVQLPGDVPLQIELLDGSGKTLKREAGWFWMRKGEQRVCVGCHAGPETSPENAVPMVLEKSTTPADMTHASVAAGGQQ